MHQTIVSTDKLTTKYIHEDGSETSFKKSHSGRFTTDELIVPVTQDKNKYSLVISCSNGCQMSCTFCHLTQKQAKFEPLTEAQVEQNLKDVITDQVNIDPSIRTKTIKLCWMGMGEAILKPEMVRNVSLNVINWALDNNYASAVDGIDISTVIPKVSSRWQDTITQLVNDTKHLPRNIHNAQNRTLVRLFYSLHSTEQELRDQIIPNAKSIDKAIADVKKLNVNSGVDLVFHYMFMDGVNDSKEQVDKLISFYKENQLTNSELRILRYNPSVNRVDESDGLETILNELDGAIPKLKVQHSSGASVDSACGMFVVDKDLKESESLSETLNHLESNIPNLKVQHSSGASVDSACGMFVVDKTA